MDDLSARRLRLDREVQNIGACIWSLNTEAARRSAALHKERNTTVSFHKLPVELHTSILQYVMEYHESPVQRLLDLSTVATNWWNLVENTPSLWTTIRTNQMGYPLALKRSKNAPLDVFLEVQNEDDDVSEVNALSEDLLDTVRTLQPHVLRWRSASIRSRSFNSLAGLFGMSLPLLQTLDVQAMDMADNAALRLKGGPVLRSINLSGVLLWFNESPLKSLETLSIKAAGLDSYAWTPNLLDALALCPRLTELHLVEIRRIVQLAPSDDALRTCSLPSLKILEIDSVFWEVLVDLVDTLRVQDLDHCTLHGVPQLQPSMLATFSTQDSEEGTIGAAFMKAVRSELIQVEVNSMSFSVGTLSDKFNMVHLHSDPQGEACRLAEYLARVAPTSRTCLTLDGHEIPPGPMSVLDTFPNIVNLRIGSYPETISALRYLITPVGSRCPTLESIYLFWAFDDPFVDKTLLPDFLERLGELKRLRSDVGVCDRDENWYGEDTESFLGVDFPLANQDL